MNDKYSVRNYKLSAPVFTVPKLPTFDCMLKLLLGCMRKTANLNLSYYDFICYDVKNPMVFFCCFEP